MNLQKWLIVAAAMSASAFADLQYEMTSRATGGSIVSMPIVGSRMKEPHTVNHYIKGNKMATVSKGSSTIWDLDAGNVTTVNTDKKTYSVMTFEEMRATMEESMKKMQDAMASKQKDVDYTWTINVTDAGDEKTVAGFTAHHYILSMIGSATDANSGNTAGMKMQIDNWTAKDVPGVKEYQEFNKRLAEKMGLDVSSSMNPMVRAQLGKGWETAAKELAKIQGFTVLSTVKTISMANGEEVMVPENSQKMPSGGEIVKESATSAVLGRIPGGLGGFGRKKKSDDQQQPAAQNGKMVPSTLIEMTTELTNLSNGVDASAFSVPAGFKKVEEKRGR